MKKIFVLLVLLAAPALTFAQNNSSMTGTVTDSAGALIPGATVTLTNSTTAVGLIQSTNSQGRYTFPNVPPTAGYTAIFAHPGFASLRVSHITLSVGVTRTQNATLSAGTDVVVDISAASSEVTLDTTDASIGNNLDVKSLNQLPVYDRTGGVTTLFNLQPGVDDTQLGGSGSVTGARNDQTSVTVDGLDVNDIAAGTPFAVIGEAPVDSVEQFTGTVAGLVPALGTGSGGQFQMVTKHGTNSFHGNINEYHRDTSTVANTYFNNNLGLGRTPLIRNQFGGNVGGPIIENKLYFFFDFADSRIIQSNTSEVIVPIPSVTSPTAPTLNYINNNAGCGDSSRLNTSPTCISSLTATQVAALDPAGIGFDKSLLAFIHSRYPAPNDPTQGDGVNTEGLRFTYPQPDFETTYVGRVDYNLTQTQKIYGRVTINRTNEVYPAGVGAPQFPGDPAGLTEVDNSYGYVVSHVWTIGKNKVNQFYYGDNISKLGFLPGDFSSSPNVYSFNGISSPYGTYNTQVRRVPIPVVRDDFNWQVKSHSLTMGGLFKFIKTNSNAISDFNFVAAGLQGTSLGSGLQPSVRPAGLTNATTINSSSTTALNDYDAAFADILGVIGEISSNFDYNKSGQETPQGAGGPRAYRFFETEAYASDTWKVSKQLTLTYGLRYQVNSVPYEVHGDESVSEIVGLSQRQSTFNNFFYNYRIPQNAAGTFGNSSLPFFQAVLGGKANNGPSSYAPSYKDFAPRVAYAYNPSYLPRTVFNGSAAIVYDRTVIDAVEFLQDYYSFLFYNNNTNQFPLGGASSPANALATDPRLGNCTTGCSGPTGLNYASSNNPIPQPILPPYVPYVGGGVPYGLPSEELGFVIDPSLKDPYNININAGVQQELPDHMILKLNYVGRMGRRLLIDADAGQVLNFPDKISGQTLSQAFGNLTQQMRANPNATSYTAQPFFENLIGNYIGGCGAYGVPNCTTLVADEASQYVYRGDLGDAIAVLAGVSSNGPNGFGLLPTNVGMIGQFGSQVYLTNKGSSNYNAMLVTLSHNLSHGLKFDVNYTWSHSIDNNSQAANDNALFAGEYSGVMCDVTRPRACRGDSDFDVRQEVTADAFYDLPFGHHQMFLANSSTLVNELLGGWSVSGIPSYRTGQSIDVLSYAFIGSVYSQDPAIFTGNKSDLKTHVNNVQGTVYNFAGGLAGSQKVFNEFRGPIGLEYGQRNIAKGAGAADLDFGLAKIFPIYTPKDVNLTFRADAFNIFNHPNFGLPVNGNGVGGFDIVNSAGTFGQINSTIATSGIANGYRVAQFSLRLEFIREPINPF